MGIKSYMCLLKYGSYGGVPKDPKRIGIYLDAEYLHYKGRLSDALNSSNAEFEIATIATKFTNELVQKIKKMFGKCQYTVYAYFDGIRNNNKEARIYDGSLDKGEIVKLFKTSLGKENIEIVQLNFGESELLMYKERDRTNCINIMVTGDSDMYPILYEHKPQKDGIELETLPKGEEKSFDFNYNTIKLLTYDEPDIKDSVSWIFVNKTNAIVCADFMNFNITKKQFRQLACYMGCDYSPPLLSKSMIDSLLPCLRSNNIPTDLTDLQFLVVILAYSFHYESARRPRKNEFNTSTTLRKIINNGLIYNKYLETGSFDDYITRNFCPSIVIECVCNLVFKTISPKQISKDLQYINHCPNVIYDTFITSLEHKDPEVIMDTLVSNLIQKKTLKRKFLISNDERIDRLTFKKIHPDIIVTEKRYSLSDSDSGAD